MCSDSVKRGVEILDMYRFKMLSDPQISPDGTKVAFVVTEAQKKQNDYRSRVFVADIASGEVVQFTAGYSDDSPRWSPDGSRIAFCSKRSGSAQIWIIPAAGGEAVQLTSMEGPVFGPRWSPDSSQIAFTHRVDLSGKRSAADDDGYVSDVMAYTRLRYKFDGEGFWDGKWRHIYVVDSAGGDPKRITDGEFDHQQPAWSACGTKIAFSAARRADADLEAKTDIYVKDLVSGEILQVTDTDGPASWPTWSCCGSKIAYYGHLDAYGGADLSRLWVVDSLGESAPRCITERFDRSLPDNVGSDMRWGVAEFTPVWAPDGKAIYSLYGDSGRVNICKVDVEHGSVTDVTSGERVIYGMSMRNDRIAFVSQNPTDPGEVHVKCLTTCDEIQVTRLNLELLQQLEHSEPERVCYKSEDGQDIEGWIMKPVGFCNGHKYPMMLSIHGGPHSAFGYCYNHQFQIAAAKGYAVLFVNPRGSTHYGQDFAKATHHDWGGKDYRDIMAGVEHALRLGYVDESRMVVTGASFGGYMTNWVIAHDNRFKAAVTEVTTANRYSQWGSSDYGHGNGKWEFKGRPWESWDNAHHYLERSPLTYVQQMDTPLLILQAMADQRCPLQQAEELYTALVVLKKNVEMVLFPGESHTFFRVGKPKHRKERLERVFAWFDRYTCT